MIAHDGQKQRRMITSDCIQWKCQRTMAMTGSHAILYRDKKNGVQWEIHTPKKSDGSFGTPKHYFFIDGVKAEFETQDDMIEFYNEKYHFDNENPEEELQLVKVIKKRVRISS